MVLVEKFWNSFRFKISSSGHLIGIDGNITSYNIKPFLRKFLTYIEPAVNKYSKPNREFYFYYDRENSYLYIPYPYFDSFLNSLKYMNITPKIDEKDISIEGKSAKIFFNRKYSDREGQSEIIDFLVNSKNRMRLIESQTGFGKTYCAIKAMTKLSRKTLIVVPGHLQDQWINEIEKLTSLVKEDIYIIRGRRSIMNLYPGIYKENHDVFVSTINTLYSYINYQETIKLHSLFDLFSYLGIGVKIMDEVHLNFRQILFVDMLLNIKHNIYLSATFMRTNRVSDKIFQNYFKKEFKFNKGEYSKHSRIREYKYSIGYISEKRVKTPKGYSEIKYEKLLLKYRNKFKSFMSNVLFPVFEKHYLDIKNPGEKCLILIKLKIFGKTIKKWIEREYEHENLKIGVYFQEHSLEYRDSLDVIISTIQSSGVGSDIKGLRSTILIDNFSAKHWLYQCLGRLRKMKGITTEFVYLTNRLIDAHIRFSSKRRRVFTECTNDFKSILI